MIKKFSELAARIGRATAERPVGGMGMVKTIVSLGWAIVFLGTVQANAQNTSNNNGELTLPGSSSQTLPAGNGQSCGQTPSDLNCFNQQLQQQAQASKNSAPSTPLGANSPRNQVGLIPAVPNLSSISVPGFAPQ